MNREELEQLIVDASDGVLTQNEIDQLEKELGNHPDLYADYQAIMKLPDLSHLYQANLETGHQLSIQKIKTTIRDLSYLPDSFEVISLNWFRKYALAASFAIFAITSVISLIQPIDEETNSETIAEEFFYPVDEGSVTENYVLYLEDLPEQ